MKKLLMLELFEAVVPATHVGVLEGDGAAQGLIVVDKGVVLLIESVGKPVARTVGSGFPPLFAQVACLLLTSFDILRETGNLVIEASVDGVEVVLCQCPSSQEDEHGQQTIFFQFIIHNA